MSFPVLHSSHCPSGLAKNTLWSPVMITAVHLDVRHIDTQTQVIQLLGNYLIREQGRHHNLLSGFDVRLRHISLKRAGGILLLLRLS